ncbi:MAG: glycosyltransferase [Bacteroidales bacterium]|nr:glycosyltransferase [Bacteroidales bacterium]
MNRIKVLLFTDSFPFANRETFLETEIDEWGKRENVDVVIFPIISNVGVLRELPRNCSIESKLRDKLIRFEKWIFLFFPIVLLNPFFWKELRLFPSIFFRPQKFRKLIAASTFSLIISRYIKRYYSEYLNSDTIFYSYWFYYAAYAGALLKKKGFDFTLISRAHGTDIFQNRKDTGCYIPFRRFAIYDYFAKIFPVSKKGESYLKSNQNIPDSKLQVSTLGIEPQSIISSYSEKDCLSILSCSNIFRVKRIDLIIKGLAAYKTQHTNVDISWHHIGAGNLQAEIEELARKLLPRLGIKYKFHGVLPNKDVVDFYKHNKVDCFVTTSSSEGMPVSIMEALCFGVPILATDVGGIAEAVNNKVGYLLKPSFSEDDFVMGLHHMHSFKDLSVRKAISLYGNEKFDAERNHNCFIDTIFSLSNITFSK